MPAATTVGPWDDTASSFGVVTCHQMKRDGRNDGREGVLLMWEYSTEVCRYSSSFFWLFIAEEGVASK